MSIRPEKKTEDHEDIDRWVDEGLVHPPPENVQKIKVHLKPVEAQPRGYKKAS